MAQIKIAGEQVDIIDLTQDIAAEEAAIGNIVTGVVNDPTALGDLESGIDHNNLINAGSPLHFTEASINHQSIFGAGTNTHAMLDDHLAVGSPPIHFTEVSIDHDNILNAGVFYSHGDIDTHINDNVLHSTVVVNDTSPQLGANLDVQTFNIQTATGNAYLDLFDVFSTLQSTGSLFINSESISLSKITGTAEILIEDTVTITGPTALNLRGGTTGTTGTVFVTNVHTTSPGKLGINDTDSSFAAIISVPSVLAADTSFVLPPNDGTSSQVLTTDGSGVTTWEDASGPITINNQTALTYVLVLTDAGKFITMNNASANNIEVPANADVAFPIGTRIEINQLGVGGTDVDMVGSPPDTLNTLGGAGEIAGVVQHQTVILTKIAATTWNGTILGIEAGGG